MPGLSLPKRLSSSSLPSFLVAILIVLALFQNGLSQDVKGDVSSKEAKAAQKRGPFLLDRVKYYLERDYYDQTFGGQPLEERILAAESRINSMANQEDIYLAVAEMLNELNDSHTGLETPNRKFLPEYGFVASMVGDKCFITSVKPGSDAEAQGLKAGDQITAFGAVEPTRQNLRKINYLLYRLKPQPAVKLSVVNVEGKTKDVLIVSTNAPRKAVLEEFRKSRRAESNQPFTCKEIDTDLVICKLRTFAVDSFTLDRMLAQVSKKKKLVLDLRGNSGGFADELLNFIGHFFERDVHVLTETTKRRTRERIAKARSGDAFRGELAVLIDSETASAAEVFARVIQLEKRGKVFGDISSGSVMASILQIVEINEVPGRREGPVYFAGLNITVGDLRMSDGQRLEGKGVIPDVPIGPSGFAISQRLDPVLSMVVGEFGGKLSPKEAGLLGFLIPRLEGVAPIDTEQ